MSTAQSPQSFPWSDEFKKRVKAFAEATEMEYDTVVEILFNEFGIDAAKSDCLTILDSEQFLPVSDIFRVFVDSKLAKIARVRMGLAHLRGKTDLEEPKPAINGDHPIAAAIKDLVEQNKPLESLTVEELLKKYDESHPEVIKRLASLSRGYPCIVLNRVNGEIQVNVEESAKLVKLAMKQPTSDRCLVGGKIVKVYRVGTEFPVEPIAESPFFPGVALVNGFCARSATDWNGVEDEARILARIYVHHVETAKLSKMQLKEVCDDARKGAAHFRDKYQEAALKYDEMKVKDELPKLKIAPGEAKQDFVGRRDTGF